MGFCFRLAKNPAMSSQMAGFFELPEILRSKISVKNHKLLRRAGRGQVRLILPAGLPSL